MKALYRFSRSAKSIHKVRFGTSDRGHAIDPILLKSISLYGDFSGCFQFDSVSECNVCARGKATSRREVIRPPEPIKRNQRIRSQLPASQPFSTCISHQFNAAVETKLIHRAGLIVLDALDADLQYISRSPYCCVRPRKRKT